MQSALRARWLGAALIALLLFAQHGALTHALSHAAAHHDDSAAAHAHDLDHRHDHHHEEGPAETAAGSCAFDLLYSEVLGAALGGHHAGFTAITRTAVVVAAVLAHAESDTVPYHSRGPPVFS